MPNEDIEKAAACIAGLIIGREDIESPSHPAMGILSGFANHCLGWLLLILLIDAILLAVFLIRHM